MAHRFVFAGICVAAMSACSPDVDQPQAVEGAETVECALGEGSQFAPDCLVERSDVEGIRILTVRHPDGGFRRFHMLDDGRGLIEADGADQAIRKLDNGVLEITVGTDRYRFPAQLKAADDSA
ncbi:MAG: hypothetical protein WAT93_13320 [Pontixanthobacter sp.]